LQTRKQPILGGFWYASAIFAALLGSIRAPRSKVKSVEMSSAGRIVERGAISAGAVNLAAADRRAPGVVQLFAKQTVWLCGPIFGISILPAKEMNHSDATTVPKDLRFMNSQETACPLLSI